MLHSAWLPPLNGQNHHDVLPILLLCCSRLLASGGNTQQQHVRLNDGWSSPWKRGGRERARGWSLTESRASERGESRRPEVEAAIVHVPVRRTELSSVVADVSL